MKKINNVVAIFCLISFISCTKDINIEIIDYIENNCNFDDQKENIIDIKKIFNLEWDTMYIFPSWTMTDDISNSLKLKYDKDYVKDDTRRVIFIKNRKIIKEEDYFLWGENRIEFEYSDWPNQIIKYSTSKFTVKRIKEGNYFLYKLEPIYN